MATSTPLNPTTTAKINVGRWAFTVGVFVYQGHHGTDGLVRIMSTTAAPYPLWSGPPDRPQVYEGWPKGATTQELYDFDRAADTLLTAAGVAEQLRKHPGLWGKFRYTVEFDVARAQILASRPDLDTFPRNACSL